MRNSQCFSHVNTVAKHTNKEHFNELLELELELNAGKNKEYKIEIVKNSIIYNKAAEDQILGLYYLISWKHYTKNESIWKPVSTVIYL